MVIVSIRSTFLHFEDAQCAGADEQPTIFRAKTAPMSLGLRRCDSASTTSTMSLDADGCGSEASQDIAQDSDVASDSERLTSASVPAAQAREPSPVSSRESPVLPVTGIIGTPGTAGRKALCEAEWTTLMLRNLPIKYTREDLVKLLHYFGFAGKFDFLYFPMDFETRGALGYAFVNMESLEDAVQLWRCMDGFSKWSLPCSKVCSVSWSQPLQGLEANVARYRNSPLMHELVPDSFRPLLFVKGERIAFPPPTKKIREPRKGNKRMLMPQW